MNKRKFDLNPKHPCAYNSTEDCSVCRRPIYNTIIVNVCKSKCETTNNQCTRRTIPGTDYCVGHFISHIQSNKTVHETTELISAMSEDDMEDIINRLSKQIIKVGKMDARVTMEFPEKDMTLSHTREVNPYQLEIDVYDIIIKQFGTRYREHNEIVFEIDVLDIINESFTTFRQYSQSLKKSYGAFVNQKQEEISENKREVDSKVREHYFPGMYEQMKSSVLNHERRLLKEYTYQWDGLYNNFLRGVDLNEIRQFRMLFPRKNVKDAKKLIKSRIVSLQKTIWQFETKIGITVYRGYSPFLNGHSIGDNIHMSSFMSTTLDKSVALRFSNEECCLYRIYIPKGSKMVPLLAGNIEDDGKIDTLTKYNESEVLLPAGCIFKVLNILHYNGRLTYDLRLIQQTDEPFGTIPQSTILISDPPVNNNYKKLSETDSYKVKLDKKLVLFDSKAEKDMNLMSIQHQESILNTIYFKAIERFFLNGIIGNYSSVGFNNSLTALTIRIDSDQIYLPVVHPSPKIRSTSVARRSVKFSDVLYSELNNERPRTYN